MTGSADPSAVAAPPRGRVESSAVVEARTVERPAVPLPRGRAPDFIVVGHPKCGTTSLYHMLRGHPQIYMPDLKEPWFFVPELHSRFRNAAYGRPDTIEQYLALFEDATPEQRAGEATPSYLFSRTAAARIAEALPHARIVAILREPVSFLRSLHLQFVQTHVEDECDFATALALEPARRGGERIPPRSPRPQVLLYSEHVRYVEQLRRFHAVFPPEQVLVLAYEDFRRDNRATVRTVLDFLGVDSTVAPAAIEANPSVRVRSQRLHGLLQAVSVGRGPASRAAKASVKTFTSRRLRRTALRTLRRRVVFARPRSADEALTLELRRRYLPEVLAVSDYLDRDLVSLWGYD
ncbi:MAG: sulfotransferase, partial [Solirubrobacteraceae bacterium]